jgi:NAD(P)-dependent dehydrogenase (short-subunit alcohol dehydrogenase family)
MERFLSGRRAFVVGGSGGIGAAISVALAGCGARLLIHGGHDSEKLDLIADLAGKDAEGVDTCLRELVNPRDALDLLDGAGEMDILVVSFGPYLERAVGETTAEDWERMIGLNLTFPALLISSVIPGMLDRGYGRIILFGGPRGDRVDGYREIAAYGAAKLGLASLARSIARQYASRNIRCNMICPGYVDTEYHAEDEKKRRASRQPSGRLISVDEIARLAVQLLHPASDAVNGAIIPVDFGV